jgi:hypothetical protein
VHADVPQEQEPLPLSSSVSAPPSPAARYSPCMPERHLTPGGSTLIAQGQPPSPTHSCSHSQSRSCKGW